MKQSTDIVIHINEDLDNPHRETFTNEVQQIPGVVSVSLQDTLPHLMVVAYNAAETRAQEVVKSVRNTGSEAQLVGWL